MNLNTTNPKDLKYSSKHLHINVLGGINLNHLDRLRVTLKVKKATVEARAIRHNIDLYNDNQLEKFIRTIAERLEIATTQIRVDLYALMDALEAHRQALTANNNVVVKTSSRAYKSAGKRGY